MNTVTRVVPAATDQASVLYPDRPPVAAYQPLSSESISDSTGKAREALQRGWRFATFAPIDLGRPIPWAFEQLSERSWNFHLHSFKPLEHLLIAYSQTADPVFLDAALRVTLDWVAEHPRGAPDRSIMAWYDMAVGLRAWRIGYIAQAAEAAGLLSGDQRAALWRALDEHRAELEDETKIAYHTNHGFFQVAGQLALGWRFGQGDPAMQALHAQGIERLHRILDGQFSPDDGHREHSPMYHHMVLEALLGLYRSGVVGDPGLWARILRIEQSLSWFILPSGHLVNFGDTDCKDLSLSPSEALTTWSTAALRAVVTGGQVGGSVPTGLKTFPASGYAIVRAPDRAAPGRVSYLAQTAAFHSRVHKHADDLSFVWFDKGQPILTDAGRYGYVGRTETGSELFKDGHWYADPVRIHVETTRAHNTLEFDGRNMPRRGATPYGSALRATFEVDGVFVIETGCTQFRTIRHDRVLIFSPGQWLVVYDVYADTRKEPHEVRQWFHLPPGTRVQARPDGHDAVLPVQAQPLAVRNLFAAGTPTEVIEGQAEGPMQGWWSGTEMMVEPAPAFAFLQSGQALGSFATLFSLSPDATPDRVWSQANASGRQAQFLWHEGGRSIRLRLQRQEGLALTCEVTAR